MCEKADESGWSRVLSDAGPSGEESRPASADTLTPTVSSETQSTLEGRADDPKRMPAQSEQLRAGVSRESYTAQGKLPPERLTGEAKEQAGNIRDHTEEKPEEALPETMKAAEEAVYQATTGKAGNVMQNVDKTINQVTEPTVGRAAETTSVAAQPMATAHTTSKDVGEPTNRVTEPVIGRAAETTSVAAQPMPTTAIPSKETDSSIVGTVMQNPLPAALIGLGLSWLLMNMYQGRKQSVGYKTGRADYLTDGQMSPTQSALSRGWGDLRERPQETESVVSQVQHQVSDIADRTREGVSNLASRVQQGARRVGHQYQQSLQENPLAVGAAALALGSAIGLALPSTGAENKLMGQAHENLMRKVDEATHGTVQKVREVAGEAGRAARREAEYQGLTT